MAPYYIVILIVALASFFIIRRYLPIKSAIGISLLGFVLTAIFPLIITHANLLTAIIIYIIIGLVASIIIKRMELPESEHNEPVAQESAIAEAEEPEKEYISKDDTDEEATKSYAETANFEIKGETEVPNFMEFEPIQPAEPEQQTEIVELTAEEEDTDGEAEYDVPDSHSFAGITRTITVEPEVPKPVVPEPEAQELQIQGLEVEEQNKQEPEPEVTETITTEQPDVKSESQQAEQQMPKTVKDDLTTDLVDEMEIDELLTVKQLISKGLSQSRLGNYNDAVKMLMEALKQKPEPALKYLAVSEISTIYQHTGFYQMAAGILAAYIKQRDLQAHPGLKTWQEKLTYLNIMIDVLNDNKLPSLPYNEVPDFIKKKAFSMTLEKIIK